jgi:hypothetical protein
LAKKALEHTEELAKTYGAEIIPFRVVLRAFLCGGRNQLRLRSVRDITKDLDIHPNVLH